MLRARWNRTYRHLPRNISLFQGTSRPPTRLPNRKARGNVRNQIQTIVRLILYDGVWYRRRGFHRFRGEGLLVVDDEGGDVAWLRLVGGVIEVGWDFASDEDDEGGHVGREDYVRWSAPDRSRRGVSARFAIYTGDSPMRRGRKVQPQAPIPSRQMRPPLLTKFVAPNTIDGSTIEYADQATVRTRGEGHREVTAGIVSLLKTWTCGVGRVDSED